MFEANNLLFTSEAARILSVSGETVRLWERTGRLHARKIGAGIRVFERDEIERLAADRRAGPAVSLGEEAL